mgnify:CR=1 FL=1
MEEHVLPSEAFFQIVYLHSEICLKTAVYRNMRRGAINERTASLILSGISDSTLTADEPLRSMLRANILKNMLLNTEK